MIGMTICPGRCMASPGRPWRREIAPDLAAIEIWGASIVLSLVEDSEFAALGVPNLPTLASARSFEWLRIPIADYGVPDAGALAVWRAEGPRVLGILRAGGRVAIHCAAGLGRTGTIGAKLLAALGQSPADAIAAVRVARPGTIETAEQEAFVHSGPSF